MYVCFTALVWACVVWLWRNGSTPSPMGWLGANVSNDNVWLRDGMRLVWWAMVWVAMCQVRGWGESSLELCARVVAEVRSLRDSTFVGLRLQQPVAVCCAPACHHAIGYLSALAEEALHAGTARAITRCPAGHATELLPLVGMQPHSGDDGHAAELRYWLRTCRARMDSRGGGWAGAGAAAGAGAGAGGTGEDVGGTATVLDTRTGGAGNGGLARYMCVSLASALVRWSGHMWNGSVSGSGSSSGSGSGGGVATVPCPRVWVVVRNDDRQYTLRPVCEHIDCLHAMAEVYRSVGNVTDVVASPLMQQLAHQRQRQRQTQPQHNHRGDDGIDAVRAGETDAHTPSSMAGGAPATPHDDVASCTGDTCDSGVPLYTLVHRCSQTLELLRRVAAYTHRGVTTVPPDKIAAAMEGATAVIPKDARVLASTLAEVHEQLDRPLQLQPVLPHAVAGGRRDMLSHLWLCQHHAKHTELQQVRESHRRCAETVSSLVQWVWHNGSAYHNFSRDHNAQLEHAFRKRLSHVKLVMTPTSAMTRSTTTWTVMLHEPMTVRGKGYSVFRISGATYVECYSCTHMY